MIRRFFLLTLSMAIAGTSAQAAIPPSATIIKRLAAKHQFPKAFIASARLIQWEGEAPGALQLKETLYYDPKTKLLTAQLQGLDGRVIYSIQRTLRGAVPVETPPTSWLMLGEDADSIVTALKNHLIPIRTESELLGIPTEKERRDAELTRLGRSDGKIAWVIGPKPDADVQDLPELWIEKDAFHPLRWKNSSADVRFGKMQAYAGLNFPSEVKLLIGTRTHAQLVLDQVQSGADPKTFPQSVAPFNEDGVPSELRDLVRLYSKYLR
jgi:hypothetical protein